MPGRYQKPDFITARVLNPVVSLVTRLGVSLRGSHVLAVRGRTSGKLRSTPVNPVTVEGERYLVAPRGDTHWARNLRARGEGVLSVGRRRERISASEVPDSEKRPILRAYLQRWYAETGKFFGVPRDATDEQLDAIAAEHPVFRITGRTKGA